MLKKIEKGEHKVHHEKKKMEYGKGLFLIHQFVDPNIVEKTIEEETIKGVWDALKKFYGGDDELKKVKLQALIGQYEFSI